MENFLIVDNTRRDCSNGRISPVIVQAFPDIYQNFLVHIFPVFCIGIAIAAYPPYPVAVFRNNGVKFFFLIQFLSGFCLFSQVKMG